MNTKHLIIASAVATLPLSANAHANCQGLNAQQRDLSGLIMQHETQDSQNKLIAVDKPKYKKAMWFMNYNVPLIKYVLQKGDDAVCSALQVRFKEAVKDIHQSSYFLP